MQITDDASWGQAWGVPEERAAETRRRLHEVLFNAFHTRARQQRVPFRGDINIPPGALGMWLLERMGINLTPLPMDLQHLIVNNTPQHRVELFGREAETIHHYDGRAMYLGCCGGLGFPGVCHRRVVGGTDIAGWERGRAKVEFTVPRDWDHIGLLPVKADQMRWHWPISGSWETWADLAEIRLARKYGWAIHVTEKIVWTEDCPLDLWSDRLSACYLRAKSAGEDDLARCLRAVVLHTIGRCHNLGIGHEEQTVPLADARVTASNTISIDYSSQTAIIRLPVALGKRPEHCHPEWSAGIWSKARLRITKALLSCDPSEILAIRGDGIWLSGGRSRELSIGWRDTGECGQLRHKWDREHTGRVTWESLRGQE